jgi:hypothetical protein
METCNWVGRKCLPLDRLKGNKSVGQFSDCWASMPSVGCHQISSSFDDERTFQLSRPIRLAGLKKRPNMRSSR